MAGERVEVAFPTEWTPHGSFEAPPLESEVTELWDEAGKCRGALFALRWDGVRLISLSWPGGARFARALGDADWAVQERFQGSLPHDLQKPVNQAWKNVLALLTAAANQAREETNSEH